MQAITAALLSLATAFSFSPLGAITNETAPTAAPAKADADSSFVQADGDGFRLDGASFRFVGTNNYYLHYKSTAMIDDVLKSASDANFSVIRMWGFMDGFEGDSDAMKNEAYMQSGPNEYGRPETAGSAFTNAFERMDYTLNKAAQYGIKLVIVFTNYWADFGGIKEYVKWADKNANGIDIYDDAYQADASKFYADAYCKKVYKQYVSDLLNRVNTVNGKVYKNDATIMSWELMNEPRNPDKDPKIVTAWVDEMSTYVKSIDSHHLVALGDEGAFTNRTSSAYKNLGKSMYDGSEGTDYEAILALKNIDYGTYHLYPESWGAGEESEVWGEHWINDHIALSKKADKPCVNEEFGISSAGGKNREYIYSMWLQKIYDLGGAGAQFWMLAGINPADPSGYYSDYDGFRLLWLGEKKSSSAVLALHNYALLFGYGEGFAKFESKIFFVTPYVADATEPAVVDSDATPIYSVAVHVQCTGKISKVDLYVKSAFYKSMVYDADSGNYVLDLEMKYFLRGSNISLKAIATLEDGSEITSPLVQIQRLLKYEFVQDYANAFDGKQTLGGMYDYGSTYKATLYSLKQSSFLNGAMEVKCKSQNDVPWSEIKLGYTETAKASADIWVNEMKKCSRLSYDVYYQKDLCLANPNVPSGSECHETANGFRNQAALDPGWTKVGVDQNNVKAADLETIAISGVDYYKQHVVIDYASDSSKSIIVLSMVFNYLGYDGSFYITNFALYDRNYTGSPTDGYVDPDADTDSTPDTPKSPTESASPNVPLIVGLSVTGGVLVLGLGGLGFHFLRKKKKRD